MKMISTRRNAVTLLVAMAWLSLVLAGFGLWEVYETTPGPRGAPAPLAVNITSRPEFELVLYAHPHCPCTRASLTELAGLAREAGPALSIRVAFVRPPGVPEGWERTSSWTMAQSCGAKVVVDESGAEALQAGAITSGTVILRDGTGRIAFRGGLTRGRGRVGESAGQRAILNVLSGSVLVMVETPVFGCPLVGPDDVRETEGGSR